MRRVLYLGVLLASLVATPAFAERASTRDALDRLQEILDRRLNDGTVQKQDLLPALLVSTQVRYEESVGWFSAEAFD